MVTKNEFSGTLKLFFFCLQNHWLMYDMILLLVVKGDDQQSVKFQRCDS